MARRSAASGTWYAPDVALDGAYRGSAQQLELDDRLLQRHGVDLAFPRALRSAANDHLRAIARRIAGDKSDRVTRRISSIATGQPPCVAAREAARITRNHAAWLAAGCAAIARRRKKKD